MTKNHLIVALIIALGVTSPAIVSEFRSKGMSESSPQGNANWPSDEDEETFMATQAALMLERAELFESRSKRLADGYLIERQAAGFHTLRVIPHNSESIDEDRSEYLPNVVSSLDNYYGFLEHTDTTGQQCKLLSWDRTFANLLVTDVALSVDPNNSGQFQVTGKFSLSSIETLSQFVQVAPGNARMLADGVDWANEARNAGEYISNFQVAIIMDGTSYNAISIRELVEVNDPDVATLLADNLTFVLAEQMVDRLGN